MHRLVIASIVSALILLTSQSALDAKTLGKHVFGQHHGWEAVDIQSDDWATGCFVQRQSSRQSADFSGYGSLSTWLKFNYRRNRIEFFSHNAPFETEGTFMVVGDEKYLLHLDKLGGWLKNVDQPTVFKSFLNAPTVKVEFGDHWIEFDTKGLSSAIDDLEKGCPY